MPGHSGALLRGCPRVRLHGRRQAGRRRRSLPRQRARRTACSRASSTRCWRSFPAGTSTSAPMSAASGTGQVRRCRQRMQAEGLKDVTQLHGYFVGRMSDYLQKKGRTLVGWDEILESGAKPGAVGMYWRSGTADKLVQMAAQNGQCLVMTPTNHCYFDYVQSPDKQTEPEGLGSARDHAPAGLRARAAARRHPADRSQAGARRPGQPVGRADEDVSARPLHDLSRARAPERDRLVAGWAAATTPTSSPGCRRTSSVSTPRASSTARRPRSTGRSSATVFGWPWYCPRSWGLLSRSVVQCGVPLGRIMPYAAPYSNRRRSGTMHCAVRGLPLAARRNP